MANLQEWAKGGLFFIFVTIMFYFYWTNIFSNLLEYVGTDWLGVGADSVNSLKILKSISWVSFIIIYISTGVGYLLFCILAGSRNDVDTSPLDLLKGIGIWAISLPFFSVLYSIMYMLITTLSTATSGLMDAESLSFATQFSWFLALMGVGAVTIAPFYYILKGYGVDFGRREVKSE